MQRNDHERLRRGLLFMGLFAGLACAQPAGAAEPSGDLASLVSVKTMHSFEGPDGQWPRTGLILATDGKLHGVAGQGGEIDNGGTAFQMTRNGHFKVLHQFDGHRRAPARPSGLVQGTDGMYYGGSGGGVFRDGVIYQMTPTGQVTIVHAFNYDLPEGGYPWAPLLQASDGYFYGTTGSGKGIGEGSIFKVSASGDFAVLYEFSYRKDNLYAPSMDRMVQASNGCIYGTAGGGAYDDGGVYRLGPDGSFEIIHAFKCDDEIGCGSSSFVEAPDGFLYGVTGGGGAHGGGAFYRMDFDGNVTLVHAFAKPETYTGRSGLVLADGYFYGVTAFQGKYDLGSIYRITVDGDFTQLYSFGPDSLHGRAPVDRLVDAGNGEFYGVTTTGGTADLGTIYRLKLK
jgi:uncharacterized repeat protein (TIGR03803 family)